MLYFVFKVFCCYFLQEFSCFCIKIIHLRIFLQINDNKIIKKIWSEEAIKIFYEKILNAAGSPCSLTNSEASEDSSSYNSAVSDLSYSLTDDKKLSDGNDLPVITVPEIPLLWKFVKQNASKLSKELLSGISFLKKFFNT